MFYYLVLQYCYW